MSYEKIDTYFIEIETFMGEVPSFTLRYSAKKKQGGRNAEGDGAAVGA